MSQAVTLSNCDREPIHVPGSVQPHGVLLVVDPAALRVLHAAGPAERLLGVEDWQGAPLSDLIGPDLVEQVGTVTPSRPGVRYIGRHQAASVPLDVSAYSSGEHLIVEFEAGAAGSTSAADVFDRVEAAANGFDRAGTVQGLCDRAATAFRSLTGFDRVMIYRFGDDGAGRVVAEARDPALHSYLNHHFPGSDVPQQARALYVRNQVRVIPDVDYAPAPLRPAWSADAPLDMSDSGLRSVSPIHVQYLRNMGVAASASVSIVQDGLLWGLVACHNMKPRLLPFAARAACRSLGGTLARRICALEEAETYKQRLRLRGFGDDVVRALATDAKANRGLAGFLPDLSRMLDADGVALLHGDTFVAQGIHPSRGEVEPLVAALRARRKVVFSTHHLEAVYPQAALFREQGAGVLALMLPGEVPSTLIWFRAEQVEVIRWAGDPHKAVQLDPDAQLAPRTSFAAWQETVSGRSRRWTGPEVEAAGRLGEQLRELELQRKLRELNKALTGTLQDREDLLRQKDFLIGEVNHRVQNSLQIVSSFLAMQGRTSGSAEIQSALAEAQRRLGAVALVHRRLYSGDQVSSIDLGRYVEELCGEAINAMDREWSQFLSLSLAPVPLSTDRAVILGLVLTELLINVNKYAYGGAPGPIEVRLAESMGTCRLEVSDHGVGKAALGPAKPGSGFGSRMIAGMVGQLGGMLVYEDNQPGLRATLTWPLAIV